LRLVVGLGNPEPAYAGTRHNLGYLAVRSLAAQLGLKRFRPSRHALTASLPTEGITLVLPTTYMNSSGLAVAAALGGRTPEPEDLIVVHDDLDLPVGRLRLRLGGASGGHRGVASVIDELGTDRFVRVKIGIGRPPQGTDAVDYVLERPAGEEREVLEASAARASEAVLAVLREGIIAAMNRYNRSSEAVTDGVQGR